MKSSWTSPMKTKLSIPAWRLCTYYQRRKSTLKKNCVQQVCMYVCSMTYSCMYVTAWCTKSCDLLSWEIKENNILKCLVSCKVLETVELCESISECSVSIWKTDWYLFISSVTMAPIEDRHLLLPKRLRKHSRRFLAKASGGMGSAKTMPPHHACPRGEMLMAGMRPCFFSAPVFSEQTVKQHNKLIKNNLESRAWLWPWKTLMIISCCDLGKT